MRLSFSRISLACRMLMLVSLLGAGVPARAQDPKAPPPPWVGEVMTLAGKRDFEGALKRLDGLPEEERKTHVHANLKGAMLTALRRFPEAWVCFKEALELSAGVINDAYHPKFNLAELDFVEKQWAAAEAGFKELLQEPWRSFVNPGHPSSVPLIYFKVALCQITTKRNAEASATYRELKGLADDQAMGASEAVLVALDFHQKKRPAAVQRLEALRKDRPAKEVHLYEDGFVEMGWMKHLGETFKPAPPSKK